MCTSSSPSFVTSCQTIICPFHIRITLSHSLTLSIVEKNCTTVVSNNIRSAVPYGNSNILWNVYVVLYFISLS